MGRGYSFDAIRVKLLLAPKKEGVVTSYRSIKRKKVSSEAFSWEFSRMTNFSLHTGGDDRYEIVQVPERRQVIWGVDLAKLADWLDTAPAHQAA